MLLQHKQAGFSHLLAIAAIVVVFGAVGTFMLVRSKATIKAGTPCAQNGYSYDIKGKGNGSDCVFYIQSLANYHLNLSGDKALKTDRQYGKLTRDAILQIQRNYGVKPIDGVVGPKTWAKLCSARTGDNALKAYPKTLATAAGCDSIR